MSSKGHIEPGGVPLPGRVSFRGRGLAFLHGQQIVLKLCPICSQWNAPKAAEKGLCGWCAYVPSVEDAEVAEPDSRA